MAAPKGNSFWRACKNPGRKPIWTDPEVLWGECVEYFSWVEENPLEEAKLVSYQGESVIECVPKKRLMTINALCLFLGIDLTTWHAYRKKEAFSKICTRAEEHITQDKMEGAAGDFFNANIIARDLGLRDKTDLTVTRIEDLLADDADGE